MALKSGVGGGGGGLMAKRPPFYSSSGCCCLPVFGLNNTSGNYSIRSGISNQQLLLLLPHLDDAPPLNRCSSSSSYSRNGNVNPFPLIRGRGRTQAHNPNSSPSPPPPPSPPDYLPDANFYKVEAILRPWRIPQVSSALLKMGIRGVTVSDVRGFGAQGGLTERQAGSEFSEDKFLAKVKMEIVVSKDQVEAVIDKIIEVARTGEIGDGKIFLLPVADVIRVRTGERGEKAERMVGGRSDMFSGA